MRRWEYLIDYNIKSDLLDEYGLEGWELVSVTALTTTEVSYGNREEVVERTFYFKREIENERG